MRAQNVFHSLALLSLIASSLSACTAPQSGPDKTAGGAVAGAGIGAGVGMVIGNQVSHIGPGAAVGAGFGLISGALTGAAMDRVEETQIEMGQQLNSIRAQTAFNRQQLQQIQGDFDLNATSALPQQIYQVYFDDDASNLRSGSIANLESIASALLTNPQAVKIEVAGHADDSGSPDYNMQLSQARARSVASYLQARGISVDQVEVKSFGSTRPVASNADAAGRQLNRRVEVKIIR